MSPCCLSPLRCPLIPVLALRGQTFGPKRWARRGASPPRCRPFAVLSSGRQAAAGSARLAGCCFPWTTASSSLFSVFPVREQGTLFPRSGYPPHGCAGALEAAGVLRAAGQPGGAGGEGPRRGYPYRAVGAGRAAMRQHCTHCRPRSGRRGCW